MTDLEALTIGRVGVDLYPEQSGVGLAQVRTFAKFLGGTATNVAVAAARLGRRSAVLTKVGPDGFGDFVRSALDDFGVSSRYVTTAPNLLTPVVFCELAPPPTRRCCSIGRRSRRISPSPRTRSPGTWWIRCRCSGLPAPA